MINELDDFVMINSWTLANFNHKKKKTFMSRGRHLCVITNSDEDNIESTPEGEQLDFYKVSSTSRRVITKQSP